MSTTSDTGTIVLDGFLITYLGAPLGCIGSSTYTLTKDYSSTATVSVTDGSGITITSGFTGGGKTFTAGSQTTYSQTNSNQVSNGINLHRTTTAQYPTPAPGSVGNTLFLGLFRPQIQLSGPPSAVLFKILSAQQEFALKESDLTADLSAQQLFKRATTQSFLNEYLPINDPKGNSLTKPRFKLKHSILLSSGINHIYTFSRAAATTYSATDTSTTTVTIVDSYGFSLSLFKASFSIGKTFSVAHTTADATATTKTVSVSTALNRSTLGISNVYWDRIFKTFVIVDAGPPGAPVAQGKITDASGNPIPGALVKITQNGVNYVAESDASGNYTIAPPSGVSLAAGSAQVTCGGVSQAVTIGAAVAHANIGGVNAVSATNRELDDLTD